jgi:hypothetical protein
MSGIDNITINFDDAINNIEIDYLSTINNIQLTVGESIYSGAPNVTTVNGMTGDIRLTASTTLTDPLIDEGVYVHNFEHNLNSESLIISVYDITSSQVIPDVVLVDSNNVTINAAIDLTGYKAVAQA